MEIAATAVCLAGLGLILWWVLGKLLDPYPMHSADLELVIRARGDGERMEQSLRSAVWLKSLGLFRCRVLLVDEGLTPQGRALARRLVGRWPWVSLRGAGEEPWET